VHVHNQPDTKSDSNTNTVANCNTKQHAVVCIQLNIDEFVGHNVIAPFLLLCFVILTRPTQPVAGCIVFLLGTHSAALQIYLFISSLLFHVMAGIACQVSLAFVSVVETA